MLNLSIISTSTVSAYSNGHERGHFKQLLHLVLDSQERQVLSKMNELIIG